MDRETVKQLRFVLEKALAGINSDKLAVSVGNATFLHNNVTFKIEIAEKTAGGTVIDRDAEALQRHFGMFGLPPDSLGKRFYFRHEEFEATGLRPKAFRFPLLGKRLRDGKIFKFPATVLAPNLLQQRRQAYLAALGQFGNDTPVPNALAESEADFEAEAASKGDDPSE